MFESRANRLFLRYRNRADGEALARLFDETAPRLFKLACHLVRETATAEDLVQATFLVAIAHPERFDGAGRVEGWLYGILWREAAKSRRDVARRPGMLDTDPAAATEPLAELVSAETRASIARVVSGLPIKHREVLEPFLWAEQRPDEIALALGRSPSTVRTQIHRGMERLRRALPSGLSGVSAFVGPPVRGLEQVRSEILRNAGDASSGVGVAQAGTGTTVLGLAGLVAKLSAVLGVIVASYAGWIALRPAHDELAGSSTVKLDAPSNSAPNAAAELATSENSAATRSPLPVEPPAVAARAANLARLTVHVVAKTDRLPLSGARVSVMMPRHGEVGESGGIFVDGTKGGVESSPITAADGLVELELAPDVSYKLRVAVHDRLSGEMSPVVSPLQAGERRDLVIELPTGDDLHYFGRVLASGSELPISGATAEVIQTNHSSIGNPDGTSTDLSNEQVLSSSSSDSEGLFELRLPSWKELDIRVHAEGFGPLMVEPGSKHESAELAKRIALHRSATLRASVTDAHGRADPDAVVTLTTESYAFCLPDSFSLYVPSVLEPSWSAHASRSGECLISELPPNVTLRVSVIFGDSTAPQALSQILLSPGQTCEMSWRCGGGCKLEGRVVDQYGEVVPGVRLWMLRAEYPIPTAFQTDDLRNVVKSAETDSNGRFALTAVSSGRWWVGPAADGTNSFSDESRAIAPAAELVVIPDSAAEQQLVLHVYRGVFIHGKVLLPTGEPAPYAQLSAFTEAFPGWFQGEARSGGLFSLGPLVPGRYEVTADGSPPLADSEPVQAQSGQDGVVVLLQASGSVSGVLEGADGEVPTGVEFNYRRRVANGRGSFEWDGHGNHAFKFDKLQPGVYDFVITGAGEQIGVLREVAVRGGAETGGLTVTLAHSAQLLVVNAGEQVIEFAVLSEGACVGEDGMNAGGRSPWPVPPGHIVVNATWRDGRKESKEIDLAAGESKELVFGGK